MYIHTLLVFVGLPANPKVFLTAVPTMLGNRPKISQQKLTVPLSEGTCTKTFFCSCKYKILTFRSYPILATRCKWGKVIPLIINVKTALPVTSQNKGAYMGLIRHVQLKPRSHSRLHNLFSLHWTNCNVFHILQSISEDI